MQPKDTAGEAGEADEAQKADDKTGNNIDAHEDDKTSETGDEQADAADKAGDASDEAGDAASETGDASDEAAKAGETGDASDEAAKAGETGDASDEAGDAASETGDASDEAAKAGETKRKRVPPRRLVDEPVAKRAKVAKAKVAESSSESSSESESDGETQAMISKLQQELAEAKLEMEGKDKLLAEAKLEMEADAHFKAVCKAKIATIFELNTASAKAYNDWQATPKMPIKHKLYMKQAYVDKSNEITAAIKELAEL